jgi:hypothetical protein
MSGVILFEGNSLVDNKPIVIIAVEDTKNTKNGNLIQTFIMRSDIDPITANRQGEDYSVCGDCIHRGTPNFTKNSGGADKRSCYVMLLMLLSVYKAYKKGKYKRLRGHTAISEWFRGKLVRLGAYGDPSVVASYFWDSVLLHSKGRTGYTHQFNTKGADVRTDMCMVSVDNLDQAKQQWKLGNRTFRVGGSITDMIPKEEVVCPASEEAGKRTTCDRCKLCSGSNIKAKSIFIVAHGNGKNHYLNA